jgi:hypothetical protein
MNIGAIAIKVSKDITGNDREDVFAGTSGGGVFRARGPDAGTWSAINSGLTNTEVHALAINGNGDVFAGTANDRGGSANGE